MGLQIIQKILTVSQTIPIITVFRAHFFIVNVPGLRVPHSHNSDLRLNN